MLLHLLVLLGLRPSPLVLPSLLSHPVETGRAHHKEIILKIARSNTQINIIPTIDIISRFSMSIPLWWTRGESNSRPQCLHYEGITTILYRYNSMPDPPRTFM